MGIVVYNVFCRGKMTVVIFVCMILEDVRKRGEQIIIIIIICILSSSLLSKNLKIRIYRTITLHAVLYGCETRSLTLREERRLSVYENRVLRGMFGTTRDEVTGEWRKLHNEELHDLYSSPTIVRVIKSR
jgi:hypothetical protein